MDVFLLPVGPHRYELYCEVSTPLPDDTARPTTIWGRLKDTFRRALAEGEAEESRDSTDLPPEKGKFRRAITRRLAEAVAEQRLLWQLRHQTNVRLVFPDDIAAAEAQAACTQLLAADRDKHRRWCVIDGVVTLASGLIAVLPGPNVLAYYFIFRTVGHYLSMKGAQQGLSRVAWTAVPSAELTELRSALLLAGDERRRRVEAVAEVLGLDRLARFMERISDRSR